MTGNNRKPTLSDERMAAFVLRYPHVGNETLAAEFGVTVAFCKNKAKLLRLNKSAARVAEYRTENQAKRLDRSPLTTVLLSHIEARRNQGATLATATDSTGRHEGHVWTALQSLVRAGRLTRVEGQPLTYFTNPIWAREFITNRDRERIASAQASQARRRADEASERAKVNARVVAASKPSFRTQEAITPAGVKVTRVLTPSHDPRYQVCPGADVPRVFSLVPVGRDPMTGRAWGVGL